MLHLFRLMIVYARLVRSTLSCQLSCVSCLSLINLVHPQEKSTDDNRERHDHEPWIDTEHGWKGQLAVIAELEKVIFNQRINFRVNTRANQNAQNAAKQTI